jgi:hypothetical protein
MGDSVHSRKRDSESRIPWYFSLMPQLTGSATLPLHTGKAPRWLFDRMSQLAPAIAEVMR